MPLSGKFSKSMPSLENKYPRQKVTSPRVSPRRALEILWCHYNIAFEITQSSLGWESAFKDYEKGSPYKCHSCAKLFDNPEAAQMHIMDLSHRYRAFVEELLQKRNPAIFGPSIYPCAICNLFSISWKNFSAHILEAEHKKCFEFRLTYPKIEIS